MATKANKNNYVIIGSKPTIAVDPSLPEFENHPFFEKKAESVKKFLRKAGLPKSLGVKKTG